MNVLVGLLARKPLAVCKDSKTFDYALPTIPVIHTALDLNARYSLSHWDSLLVAACIEAGVKTLYSEDMADGADYDGVRIVNPFRNSLP